MGNLSRAEQEAQAPQARQVGFVVSAWGQQSVIRGWEKCSEGQQKSEQVYLLV